MSTPWIVQPFDVIKHVPTGLVPGGVVPAVQALAFDRREEALDRPLELLRVRRDERQPPDAGRLRSASGA